jgi:hypothetical protein
MTCLTIRQSQKTEQSLTEALTELVRDESTLLSPQSKPVLRSAIKLRCVLPKEYSRLGYIAARLAQSQASLC